jgi:RNA polymerase sigma-70 factor (ECF subfamily)
MDIEEAHHLPNFDAMEDHLQTEDLMQMISELPVGYRTVFNLYAIEGYSHKEIAEQLNINENTSKSQLSRARVHLQKRLAEMEQEITVSHGNS